MRFVTVQLLLLALLFALTMLAWKVEADEGQSIISPCPCPRIYRPVCGTDSKTYANECVLACRIGSTYGQSNNLKLLREGECHTGDAVEQEK